MEKIPKFETHQPSEEKKKIALAKAVSSSKIINEMLNLPPTATGQIEGLLGKAIETKNIKLAGKKGGAVNRASESFVMRKIYMEGNPSVAITTNQTESGNLSGAVEKAEQGEIANQITPTEGILSGAITIKNMEGKNLLGATKKAKQGDIANQLTPEGKDKLYSPHITRKTPEKKHHKQNNIDQPRS